MQEPITHPIQMRQGLLRSRLWPFFPHLRPDPSLLPTRPSRPPDVSSLEENLRKDEDPGRLPESDSRQIEDRGHQPVPQPHRYSGEEGKESGSENNRRHDYSHPCPNRPLRPSLATANAAFMIRHRMPPILKSIVHPILERRSEFVDRVTLPRHQRIDRHSRSLGELLEGDSAQRLGADDFALRRGQGIDRHLEGGESLIPQEQVLRIEPRLHGYLFKDLLAELGPSCALLRALASP